MAASAFSRRACCRPSLRGLASDAPSHPPDVAWRHCSAMKDLVLCAVRVSACCPVAGSVSRLERWTSSRCAGAPCSPTKPTRGTQELARQASQAANGAAPNSFCHHGDRRALRARWHRLLDAASRRPFPPSPAGGPRRWRAGCAGGRSAAQLHLVRDQPHARDALRRLDYAAGRSGLGRNARGAFVAGACFGQERGGRRSLTRAARRCRQDWFQRRADVVLRGYSGYNTRLALAVLRKQIAMGTWGWVAAGAPRPSGTSSLTRPALCAQAPGAGHRLPRRERRGAARVPPARAARGVRREPPQGAASRLANARPSHATLTRDGPHRLFCSSASRAISSPRATLARACRGPPRSRCCPRALC
jgi:hypothetical protein